MQPELYHRSKHTHDLDDLACDFVENEVGRYNWSENWSRLKALGTVRQKLEEWLGVLNVDVSPDELITKIDDMAAKNAGRWRS